MTDASEIHELDASTIERIAAGEVVERPASAVKELVENSLDAGASRVDVTVSAGGTEQLTVADDGQGMTAEALERAVKRHTTSKITDVEDLERGVQTLGFRGEALSAIGAVARLTITSCPEDAAGAATELRVEGGEIVGRSPASRGPGTTVEVTDLFYNVPARQEFLKSEATEFRHLNRVVSRYALANPDVAISLTHGDRETFATPGTGDREAAVLAVYGREVAEAMVEVSAEPDGPLDRVHGLVSEPETTRSSGTYISTFVNGRYVEDDLIQEAIIEAYGGQLAADRFPFATLFIECPPSAVDPNVHPRKLAVRFEDETAVRDAVESAVRTALLDAGLVRSGAPRGRSAPEETTIEPNNQRSLGPETEGGSDTQSMTTPDAGQPALDTTESPSSAPGTRESSADESRSSAGSHGKFEPPSRDQPLDGEEGPREVAAESLPPLTVLGQLAETYIVAESPDGIVLVDQHAADERVNFERLRDRLAGTDERQALVAPVELELTAAEATTLRESMKTFDELGFSATLRDDRTAVVSAVPAVLGDVLDPDLLQDVLAGALEGSGTAEVTSAAEALLADLACHPAVTAGTSLPAGSVVELLEALDECRNPYACPHGRPTLVSIDIDEIEDRFERDYPGHATRRPLTDDDG
ncbi:MAG: DNA mismatch repair endonuclease MutL [Halodesulfurarchaeum sp.]